MEKEEIEEFESEYADLAEEDLGRAKELFRETFAVRCFVCGHTGKTLPPLNCSRCGAYLD